MKNAIVAKERGQNLQIYKPQEEFLPRMNELLNALDRNVLVREIKLGGRLSP